MSEHTKTPWAVSEYLEVGPVSREMDQTNGFVIPVADVYGDNMHDDAYFIVKAVNYHERLVEAFRELVEIADEANGHYPHDTNAAFWANDYKITRARTILQELEGEL